MTRIVIPGTIGGVVGSIIAAAAWLLGMLPASPDPVVWHIVLVTTGFIVSFNVGVSWRRAEPGQPEQLP